MRCPGGASPTTGFTAGGARAPGRGEPPSQPAGGSLRRPCAAEPAAAANAAPWGVYRALHHLFHAGTESLSLKNRCQPQAGGLGSGTQPGHPRAGKASGWVHCRIRGVSWHPAPFHCPHLSLSLLLRATSTGIPLTSLPLRGNIDSSARLRSFHALLCR